MTKIKIVLVCIVALIITGLTISVIGLDLSNKRYKKQTAFQERVIDSLLARRMKVFDVQLYVTDKSTNKIYGRYNKGTITMPNEKIYLLELDSLAIK